MHLVQFMMVTGPRITKMDKAHYSTKMETNMKVSGLMEKNQDMEFISIKNVTSMKGKIDNLGNGRQIKDKDMANCH